MLPGLWERDHNELHTRHSVFSPTGRGGEGGGEQRNSLLLRVAELANHVTQAQQTLVDVPALLEPLALGLRVAAPLAPGQVHEVQARRQKGRRALVGSLALDPDVIPVGGVSTAGAFF